MNITWEITKLFIKITGIKNYEQQLEFGLHTFMGLFFGSLGFFISPIIAVAYIIYVLQDELHGDRHYVFFTTFPWNWKKSIVQGDAWDLKDFLLDLFSKLIGILLFGAILWVS